MKKSDSRYMQPLKINVKYVIEKKKTLTDLKSIIRFVLYLFYYYYNSLYIITLIVLFLSLVKFVKIKPCRYNL